MGQVPFRPPSVGGWPAGAALADHRGDAGPDWPPPALRPPRPTCRRSAAPRPEPAGGGRRLLGVDGFTARTADAISRGRRADRPTLVALAAVSPEYVVSR